MPEGGCRPCHVVGHDAVARIAEFKEGPGEGSGEVLLLGLAKEIGQFGKLDVESGVLCRNKKCG